jgi:opacity protein-like surface antigen
VNFNGGSGSIAYNLTPMIGIVGDIGGYHYNQSGGDVNVVSYLFGPKIAMRRGPITPFAQALFGGAHGTISANNSCPGARVRPDATFSGCGSTSENAFAMALGGGVDWNTTDHIGIRLIQAEYLLTRFGFGGPTYSQNNARISAGVVFRF